MEAFLVGLKTNVRSFSVVFLTRLHGFGVLIPKAGEQADR